MYSYVNASTLLGSLVLSIIEYIIIIIYHVDVSAHRVQSLPVSITLVIFA